MSLISADSWAWLEAFEVVRNLGFSVSLETRTAKEADAFRVLDREMRSLEQEQDG